MPKGTTVSAIFFLSVSTAFFAQAADPKEAYLQGVALAEEHNYEEAISHFKVALEAYPNNPDVLWNIGIAASQVSKPEDALQYWLRYRSAAPGDIQGIAKLIQTYQALGKKDARDRERANIIKFRSAAKDEKTRQLGRYCIEQLTDNGKTVFAFEPLESEWAIFYEFVVTDMHGRAYYRVSLGSYDATNAIARESGEITDGERVYHVDRYFGDAHETYAFFKAKHAPSYDQIRPTALKWIQEVNRGG